MNVSPVNITTNTVLAKSTLKNKVIQHSTNFNVSTDCFSKQNNVSFGTNNIGGKVTGGVVGIIGGGLVGITACVLTAGTAIPFLAAYFAGLGATTAVGVGVGHAIDKANEKEDERKSKISK